MTSPDEACAIAGIEAAGHQPDPAQPVDGWDKSRF